MKATFIIQRTFIVILLVTLSLAEEKICRALALRGGGTKGAYEVGVLKGFLKNLKPEDVAYDVIVGVSIGGLNAATLSLYPQGKEQEAVDFLENFWLKYQVQDLWSFWPSYLLGGIYKDALLDDSKISSIIQEIFSNVTFHRKIAFQSVDINTGNIIIFDETVPDDLRWKAVKSTASIPGFFSPVTIDNLKLVDGGTFENLGLAEAIVKCRDLGANDHNIIVDIVLCFDRVPYVAKWTMQEGKFQNTWTYVNRKKELKDNYYYLEDFERVIKGFPHIKFRYIVVPSESLPAMYVPIYSKKEDIEFQLEIGEKDAEALIQARKYSNVQSINKILLERNTQSLQQ